MFAYGRDPFLPSIDGRALGISRQAHSRILLSFLLGGRVSVPECGHARGDGGDPVTPHERFFKQEKEDWADCQRHQAGDEEDNDGHLGRPSAVKHQLADLSKDLKMIKVESVAHASDGGKPWKRQDATGNIAAEDARVEKKEYEEGHHHDCAISEQREQGENRNPAHGSNDIPRGPGHRLRRPARHMEVGEEHPDQEVLQILEYATRILRKLRDSRAATARQP